jgi:hypothetical protein
VLTRLRDFVATTGRPETLVTATPKEVFEGLKKLRPRYKKKWKQKGEILKCGEAVILKAQHINPQKDKPRFEEKGIVKEALGHDTYDICAGKKKRKYHISQIKRIPPSVGEVPTNLSWRGGCGININTGNTATPRTSINV